MRIKKMQSEKGNVLVMVLILSAIMIALGSALLFVLISEVKTNRVMEEREIATYLAYSGIEHGIKTIENTPEGEDPIMPAGAIVVYNNSNKQYEYQVIEISINYVKSAGRIVENGEVIREITMSASIDDNGNVRLIKQ
ncbi:MAG: hypothetical protein HPY74_01420 [Firmicutes bacterium]|nr:hypothetical protein [Bacillota bacterium]